MMRTSLAMTAATAALALTAYGGAGATSTTAAGAAASPAPATNAPSPIAGGNRKEVARLVPRLVISHDAGLTTLDSETGEVLAETHRPGFLRLAEAGDGRHVLVTDGDAFLVFDAGVQVQPHGEHDHAYTFDPGLTGTSYASPQAGHVVAHADRTSLFSDGTGEILVLDSKDIAAPEARITRYRTDAPHHGVAFELSDGSLFTTQGTTESRNVVEVRRDGDLVARTGDCPGSHGEATAAPTSTGDVVVMGCENGPVVYRDGAFHKVPVTDAYSRSGNLFGTHESPIVLGDYKVDEKADPERPTRIALIDTRKTTLDLVDLGSAYWFRSFARGPKGEGLVLTYEGTLRILDVATGRQAAAIPVIEPWSEKKDWQEPGPAVKVQGDKAFVTDAENRKLAVVDLTSRTVARTIDLPHAPVEIAVVDGRPQAAAERAGHDHVAHAH